MPIGLGHWDEDEADEEEELPDNISQFIQLVFAELNNTSPDIVRKALQLLYDSRKLLGEKQFISAGALRGKLLDLVENGEATLAFISIDFLSYFVDEYPHIVSEIPHVIFKQRLREFLGDVDEDIIRRTIQELTKIAHHNPQEFAPLVSQVLERSQPMHYSVLILALNFVETIILANVVVDAESLFDVLHSLPDEDSEIRLHLTKIYMGLYFDDDRVIQVLRNYLQDNRHSRTPSNPYDSMKISASRFKAAEALARQDIDAGYDYLLDHLLNGSVGGWGLPGSKQSALHILANLGTERARLLLEEHTDYYKDDESN